MYVWTMFGLASKAAHKSHHTEVLLCEMVCEVQIALLLLTFSHLQNMPTVLMLA